MPLDLAPAPGGRRGSFRVALRMARRDINRHKGRSLLIILLIMLPVAGMTGAVTLFQSTQKTSEEIVRYELGGTQARFSALPVPNADSVQDPLNDTMVAHSTGVHDADFTSADPAELIPPGYEVLPQRQLDLTTGVGAATVSLQGWLVDALHPAFTGKYSLLEGRAPRSSEEILVSPGLLERFSLGLGEQITTSAGSFVPVGTLRDADASDRNSFIFLRDGQVPDSVLNQQPGSAQAVSYYLVGPEPVTWALVRAANSQGVGVLSRSVVFDPPSADQQAIQGVPPPQRGSDFMALYATFGLIAALALLEVGLLAGAAFAVGAKRQVRELALLAASGADSPTVRSVVTAGGLWLGGIAVLSGAALGLCSAAAVVHWVRFMGSPRFPGFHPDVPLTLVSMVMGLVCCILAAMAPANQVARQAALGALKSGRAPAGNGKRTSLAGAALLLVAGGLLATGWLLGQSAADPDIKAGQLPLVAGLLIAGAVLAVVGFVLIVGWAIVVLTARTDWLPLSVRLAARDSTRNRGRTIPAVAAVLAAATLASAALVLLASQQAGMREDHYWNALENQTFLPLSIERPFLADGSSQPPVDVEAADLSSALTGALGSGVAWTKTISAPAYVRNCAFGPGSDLSVPVRTATSNCLQYSLAKPPGNECPVTPQGRVVNRDDWRCRGSLAQSPGSQSSIMIGNAEVIGAALGREAGQEALAVLDAGGMVVTNPVFVRDGETVLLAQDVRTQAEHPDPYLMHKTVSSTALAAAVVEPAEAVPYYGFISEETAQRLGMQPGPAELLVQLNRHPSAAEADAASAAVAAVYQQPRAGFWVEPGISQENPWMTWSIVAVSALITFSAAGITAGLSLADARPDHATLAAVGASPRLRKGLAGSQALLTSGLGTLLGCSAGALPAVLIVSATGMSASVDVPWLHLLALLVAVPLTGAFLAWLFTRARLPASRRAVGI